MTGAALELWTASAGRGRAGPAVDVQLEERNVYAPDIVWCREGRAPNALTLRPIPCRTSRSRSARRRPGAWTSARRRHATQRHGLPELWLVDTADVVLVFRRSSPAAARFDVSLELTADDALTSPLLPGFPLPVGEIFAD